MDGRPDLLAILHEEILATITKQVAVGPENVRVRFDGSPTASTLEISVDIPHAGTIFSTTTFPFFSAPTARDPLASFAQ
jgi:septum formation topological specificity factor MinE